MLIEMIALTGIFSVGYKKFQQQKKKYTKDLLIKQKRQTLELKAKQAEKTEAAITSYAPTRALAITPKDLVMLAGAMGLSAIGLTLYHPLYYLAPPLILYAARKRFFSAYELSKKKQVGIETLSSISVLGAIISQHFFIASLLGFINGFGDFLASRIVDDSQHKLANLFQDMPKAVWLLKEGVEISISLDDVKIDDILVVSAGEIIPADGRIIWGTAEIDEQRFTGESVPVEKTIDDEVFAMTLILSGKIHLKIEKAGSETSAMQIAHILDHTADYKSSTVLEAQALSRQLINPALLVSALTWPIFGFSAAIGVLFLHPKERLQVSAPISLMTYLKQSIDDGILIKDGRSLELLFKVDTIVFDKTGTLTEDKPHVGQVHALANYDDDEVLYYATIAEHKQSHPLAQAIFEEAKKRNIERHEPEHSEFHLGYGVKVTSQGKTILVGSMRFMRAEGMNISEQVQQLQEDARLQGHGIIMVGIDTEVVGAIELLPTIRAEAKATIQALKQLAQIKQTYIISGDHEAPTRKLADELGIDHYFAQTLPQQKAERIENLQQDGAFVCFIGDGINDAIAMKQAQVSISLSGASQLATDTAQVLLLEQGITHLPRLFELAQGFNHHMKRQLSMILAPSMFGMVMIVLAGAGMSAIMLLNMLSLTTTLSYSLIDHPKEKKKVVLSNSEE